LTLTSTSTLTNTYPYSNLSLYDIPDIRFKKALIEGSFFGRAISITTKTDKTVKQVVDSIVSMLGGQIVLDLDDRSFYVTSLDGESSWCVDLTIQKHPAPGIMLIQVKIAGDKKFVLGSLKKIRKAFPDHKFPAPKVRDDQVDVNFWRSTPQGRVIDSSRRLRVDLWPEIKANYPLEVRRQLDKLMKVENPTAGKLVVLHGPPGGGKTRSILSLMKAWAGWASANVVTDPERLLNDSNYLNEIIFESIETGGWMFIVIEDGDEFLNVDAKDAKGQDIGRLLNLTDGIIGQGVKIFLLISTNLKQEKMNPAVVRDGRCLAENHYRPFTVEEATAWLVDHGKSKKKAQRLAESKAEDGEVTLANLYHVL
jgi:hypothetical protein